MEKQEKKMPAAKAVALVALAFLVVLGGLFILGLIQTGSGKETYGLSSVIDELKAVFSDVGGYFKGIWANVQQSIKALDKGEGIADLCWGVLVDIFPLVAILCYFMVALRVLFCWLPLVFVPSIGWSRVAVRMGKRLKRLVGGIIGFLVYAFAVRGGDVKLSIVGIIVLCLIAAYAILRVVLDGLGKKASVLHICFTALSAAMIAVFAIIAFQHFLSMEMPLWRQVFGCVESAVVSMQGDGKSVDAMLANIVTIGALLSLFIAWRRVVKCMTKQIVMNRSGVRKSLIWLLVWTLVAAVLSFFACRKMSGKLSFNEWKESCEFFVKSAIYGIVGLLLVILTPVFNCIGRKKAKKEGNEEEEYSEVDKAEKEEKDDE